MATEKGELDRRKELIKQMLFICEKDVKPISWDAADLCSNFIDKCQDENDIALLAADDDMFISALRVFTSAIAITCYDDEVVDITPLEGE